MLTYQGACIIPKRKFWFRSNPIRESF